jgi:hypothetical protein
LANKRVNVVFPEPMFPAIAMCIMMLRFYNSYFIIL